jgi:hypothetical protein
LLYVLAVVAVNPNLGGVSGLVYVGSAILAPIAVVFGENVARRGDDRGEIAAQMGLGTIFGLWALPASSGVIALLAIAAGVRSVATSSEPRRATAALLVGVGLGVVLLVLSFQRI